MIPHVPHAPMLQMSRQTPTARCIELSIVPLADGPESIPVYVPRTPSTFRNSNAPS